jgi:hypothetical protein
LRGNLISEWLMDKFLFGDSWASQVGLGPHRGSYAEATCWNGRAKGYGGKITTV